jgi:hypothetical protein
MSVTDIKEIRILPPLALGRFGSSAEPMHNYDTVVTPGTGFRELRPGETLLVNPSTGEIVAKQTPSTVRFKDSAGRVKPVCPFLEIWARFDEEAELRPLTLTELGDLQRGLEHVSWDVTFGNLKVLRRTGEPGDRVEARVRNITTHERRALQGRCANFKADRFVALGSVQYVKATTTFPEIRLRFTPPAGLVYGHTASAVIPAQNAVYDRTRGTWDTHSDDAPPSGSPDPRAHIPTVPSGIYATNQATGQNLGYLDDACDGIIAATLTLKDGRQLSSFARASAGPPDYAPDSDPVRNMQDELEQMVFGPAAQDVNADEVLDIVRRALETMRLMNTDVWNTDYSDGAFQATMAAYATAQGIHSGLLDTLAKGLAAPANSSERQAAHGTLQSINAILREYDAIGDRRPEGRRRMPALMRGADGNDLAINRRRRSQLRKALDKFQPQPTGGDTLEVAAMVRMIGNFSAMSILHTGFAEDGVTLADRFSDPPKVLEYLRKAAAKGNVATAAGLAGKPLVVPGDPPNSAFLQTISRPEHPMNGPLSSYRDPTSGKSGPQVVADWIASLGAGV